VIYKPYLIWNEFDLLKKLDFRTKDEFHRRKWKPVARTPEYRWQGQMEIFENLALMYRQNFKNVPPKCSDCRRHQPKKSKFVWIVQCPSGLKKPKICLGLQFLS
jgi:hypothetical protein